MTTMTTSVAVKSVNLNEWLKKTALFFPIGGGKEYQKVRETMKLKDGTTLSVQASFGHYSLPRLDYAYGVEYTHVEVWCVSCDTPESWKEYGNQEDDPYAYIPVSMVEDFINAHGGIEE